MKIQTLFIVLALLVAGTARDARAQDFQVVVNASVTLDEVSADQLAKVFQKKASELAGQRVVPVDQDAGSVREAFSQAVHGRSASAIESFWQQQIFAGKAVPPDRKADDAEVLSFVSSTPGAVGYVSTGTSIPDGVKILRVSG